MKGNNRGITLIALVVTIIVLLILASVSIRLLLGDNGILTKSTFAAFAEEMSSVEEQVILARGAEQTNAIINGTEDTVTISEDGIFVAKYNDEQITDKLKRDIVELRENNRNSGMAQEEIDTKYEALKNAEGNIDGLLYINKKYAKGKDRTYLFDTKTSTVIKVPGKMIDGEEYHIYKWNRGGVGVIGNPTESDPIPEIVIPQIPTPNVPKPEEPDLTEHKPIEEGWIPIYTTENYKKVATEEQNYDIYDLNGTKIGTYNMTKDAKYRMMNDIDFAEETVDPIKGFKGTFDGNGYYIKNIKVNNENTNKDTYYYYSTDNMKTDENAATTKIGAPTGLFDRIESGRVENLGINNANVIGYATAGKGLDWQGKEKDIIYASNVGILAGEVVGTEIENCIIQNSYASSKKDVNVSDSLKNSDGPVGALVGWVYEKETPTKIDIIKIDNVEIVGSNITSGLVAVITGNIEVANCTLVNSTINMQRYDLSSYCSEAQAGIIGHSYATEQTIEKCYVADTKFINNMQKYDCTTSAGIFGGMYNPYRNNTTLKQTLNIANCIVENCEFPMTFNGAGICGNTGFSNSDHGSIVSINNCLVDNIKLDNATSGGILAYSVAKYVDIQNCNVNNFETVEDTHRENNSNNINRGGIVGQLYCPYNIIIKSCSVTDSNIVAYDTKDQLSITAGILASNWGYDMKDGDNIIKDCFVSNSTIKTKIDGSIAKTASGISCNKAAGIAGSSGSIDVDSCYVKGSYIMTEAVNQYTGTSYDGDLYFAHAAGIVGENLLGPSSKKVTTVSNCKILNTEITSNYSSAYGIQPYIYSSWGDSYNIVNCDIGNSLIKGKRSSAGVCNYGSVKAIVVDSCDMINSQIISEDRNVAGIMNMGCLTNNTIKNCTIQNCEIKNLNHEKYLANSSGTYYCNADAGGIISYTQTANIENCTVKNTEISNKYQNTGGIIGCAWTQSNINGCTVENIIITSEKENVGGIIGIGNKSVVKDCKVIGTKINAKSVHTGGIQGYSMNSQSNSSSIEDNIVKDLEINSEDGIVGGVIGLAAPISMNITNTNVENLKITTNGQMVGGIAGFYGAGEILNCNVKSSIINSQNYDVGGLIGTKNSSATIENCTVESTQIIGKDRGVGGLVGQDIGPGEISNSMIKNSKVTITGADAKGVGGIVGYGSNLNYSYNYYGVNMTAGKSTIVKCQVLGTEITGVDYVGGISGVASVNIQECEVDETSTVSGRNAVGGIQGFGGILGDATAITFKYTKSGNYTGSYFASWEERSITPTEWYNSNITDCKVNNTTIKGSTDVNYIQGKNSYYVDGYAGTTGEDSITSCTYENTSLNVI